MKYRYINSWMITMVIVLMTTVGCKESFFDINDNPGQIADPAPELTLPTAEVALGGFLQGQYNSTASTWVQYLTQAGNIAGVPPIEQYVLLPGDNAHQNTFQALYSGPLADLEYTSSKAAQLGNNNIVAVAELLKAYAFQVLVDNFDKVPYFQALQGLEFPTPAYDEGEDIYADLLVKIDDALALIDPSATIEGDLIYEGDMSKWVKFANTLKLKIYMRQSEVNSGAISIAGIATLSGAEFIGLGEDAEIRYAETPTNNRHPAFPNDINVQTFTAASSVIIDTMLNRADPRIDVYYRKPVLPEGAPHKGVPQGLGSDLPGGATASLDYYSARGEFLIRVGAASVFFSAAESYLLQAEAVARGWMTGDAEELYESGIAASFDRTGLTAAQANTYIAANPYPNGTLDENLETILTEKWIILGPRQGLEAFAEWRRTGIPDLEPSPKSTLPAGEFPLRFPWIAVEASLNPNTPEVVPLQTPVWWDVD